MVAEELPNEGSEIEFEDTETEGEDAQIVAENRVISTQPADPEVASLYRKWKSGKLILAPSFQRKYVWDAVKASRLIESAILRVPIPVVYLAESPPNQELVIDGQQRLTSFFSFMDGKHPNGSPFVLRKLEVYPELNGKSYADLDEDFQDKINYCQIRTITISAGSDPDIKFKIFERLNTGSVALNDMELRNCVYRGPYIELLKDLAAHATFRKMLGLTEPDRRMKDVELALRFASFYHATYLKYDKPMKRYFNKDMAEYQNLNASKQSELRTAFNNATDVVWSLFGASSFKRFTRGDATNHNGRWEPHKFNASLFDVTMGIARDFDKNRIYGALDAIREGLIDLMACHQDFQDCITQSTSDTDRVRRRFHIVQEMMQEIMRDRQKQPRCFSRSLKQELYDADATCAICGQHIADVDDAAVDHIKQYWCGGETIPENARLTHRYCNLARPRKDTE